MDKELKHGQIILVIKECTSQERSTEKGSISGMTEASTLVTGKTTR